VDVDVITSPVYQEVVSISWASPDSHVWTAGEVLTASNMNTYIRLNLDWLYGDTTWTAPVFTNGWANYGSGANNGGFRLVGTRVALRGTIALGTLGQAAFTLPVGYRPLGSSTFVCISNNALGSVGVFTTGLVTPTIGSNAWFSLEGMTFDTI
jgi:hypothetical protein